MGQQTDSPSISPVFSRSAVGPMQQKQQLLFRDVALHLIRQDERSSDGEDSCKYRHGDLKCAVGCLIKDEHYSPDLEERTINSKKVTEAVEKSIGRELREEDLQMLEMLQNIHDYDHPEEWKLHLKAVGLRFFNKDLQQLNVLGGV